MALLGVCVLLLPKHCGILADVPHDETSQREPCRACRRHSDAGAFKQRDRRLDRRRVHRRSVRMDAYNTAFMVVHDHHGSETQKPPPFLIASTIAVFVENRLQSKQPTKRRWG